ncbi:MAG: redox-regulated ATPase YchF [Candidatus Niyogibacteria bacterium]|nr:redox-regulated ATPase YchF [Candidatus Niyogibacteria bacterium]
MKTLSIGIVGLPNVGKSTLFSALTQKQVDCANYPFCTIDPNVGVVAVPDARVDKLAELTKSERKIYATVDFVDIAGLVKGAAKGEGLGNQFLTHIRETDAILYVLRAFKNPDIINTEGSVNPWRDKETLETELALKDLETLDKRLSGLEREVRTGKKEVATEFAALTKAKKLLEEGKILYGEPWSAAEAEIVGRYQLLSQKPRLFALNASAEEAAPWVEEFKKHGLPALVLDVKAESEAGGLTADEREELGLAKESGLDALIKKSYELLGLIIFLTTGPDETRAWTIRNGSKAPQAAGVIHTDFEKKFIRADVIEWNKLVEAGGFAKAREKGWIRTEGKEYIVEDGDVLEIKHGA